MENLPEDIILNILCRLPAESVLKCKLVSQNWLRILRCCNSTYFASEHLHHQLRQLADYKAKHGGADKLESGFGILYAMRYDKRLLKAKLYFGNYGQRMNHEDLSHSHYPNKYSPLFQFGFSKLQTINHDPFCIWVNNLIVGSCNGLVCVNLLSRYGFEDPIYICNPLTGEYIYLDRFNQECQPQDSMFTGFGYLPQTGEYKVVRIQATTGKVQVYTLGDGIGWRNKGEIDMSLQGYSGIFANGSLYWFEGSIRKVVAFDLAAEVFQVIQSPTCHADYSNCLSSIHLLGGCLCLVNQDLYGPVELWLYRKKKDGGCGTNVDSHYFWSKEYMIAKKTRGLYRPLALTERGQILLWEGGDDHMLCCYDPKTTILLKLVSCSDMSKSFRQGETVLHMNSFVSLKALGEKFAKISRRPY